MSVTYGTYATHPTERRSRKSILIIFVENVPTLLSVSSVLRLQRNLLFRGVSSFQNNTFCGNKVSEHY